jgi:hypothetical protein
LQIREPNVVFRNGDSKGTNTVETHQIEDWAYRIIEGVGKRQPSEDSRVELKAEWPDPIKAARRIAGHANASSGGPILWLIGVNEQRGVVGAAVEELSTWFARVKAQFEELAPVLMDVNVPVGDLTVVALLFETDRVPYVVKNSAGGPVQFEVPWREATSIRSARRSDLIRVLSPLRALPEIEVLRAELEATRAGKHLNWILDVDFYISVDAGHQVDIPYHRYDVSIEEYDRPLGSPNLTKMSFAERAMRSPDNMARQASGSHNRLVMSNSLSGVQGPYAENLRLMGPSTVTLSAVAGTELIDAMTVTKVLVRANLRPVRARSMVPIDVILTKRWGDNQRHQWLYEGDLPG